MEIYTTQDDIDHSVALALGLGAIFLITTTACFVLSFTAIRGLVRIIR
jgi:hypothetical protein